MELLLNLGHAITGNPRVRSVCGPPNCSWNEKRGQVAAGLLGNTRVFQEGNRSSLRQRLREKESGGLLFLRSATVPFSVYAAPTLIYHYVRTHHYKPPDEFLRALRKGPRPPDREYFDRLADLRLDWNRTSSPPENPVRTRYIE